MAKKYQSQLKKPLSPYFLYRSQVFQSVRLEKPDASVFELTKIIGKMWENLPQTEKTKLEAEYIKSKQFYENQLLENGKELHTKSVQKDREKYEVSEEEQALNNDDSDQDDQEFKGKSKKATGKKVVTSKPKGLKKRQNKAAKTNKRGKSVKETTKKSANKSTSK